MEDEKQAKPINALVPAILWAAFHGLLWFVLLVMMVVFGPACTTVLTDFELDLPVMGQWILTWSLFSASYWYLILPLMTLLWAADFMILRVLYLRPKAAILRSAWLGLMLLVPLGLMALTVLTVHIPLIRLIRNLQ